MIIVGTRPEIIRLATVIQKCRKYFDTILVHTDLSLDLGAKSLLVSTDLLRLGVDQLDRTAALHGCACCAKSCRRESLLVSVRTTDVKCLNAQT